MSYNLYYVKSYSVLYKVFSRFNTILFLHERRCYQYIIESKINRISICALLYLKVQSLHQ